MQQKHGKCPNPRCKGPCHRCGGCGLIPATGWGECGKCEYTKNVSNSN